jgi:hypothetical protein
MFKYIGKDPDTRDIEIKLFYSISEANRYRLMNIDKYPDYKIVFISSDKEVEKEQAIDSDSIHHAYS